MKLLCEVRRSRLDASAGDPDDGRNGLEIYIIELYSAEMGTATKFKLPYLKCSSILRVIHH